MAKLLSICALFYGDHVDLARRCLHSLESNLPTGQPFVRDIRLGLNATSPANTDFVRNWAEDVAIHHKIPVLVYQPERNVWKYPLMRRMFHELRPGYPLGDFVMWFDDDAYLEPRFRWPVALDAAACHDMIGHLYHWYVQGDQWKWVQRQPWYDRSIGPLPVARGRPVFVFAQGSWWIVRSSVLVRYDWPTLLLRHNGGDALLGELLRQQRLRLGHFVERVRVNANYEGQDSRSPRRGYSEKPLGFDLAESTHRDLGFHRFDMTVWTYTVNGWRDEVSHYAGDY
jgi:hypothetical protein